jgi:hypothetical protein
MLIEERKEEVIISKGGNASRVWSWRVRYLVT